MSGRRLQALLIVLAILAATLFAQEMRHDTRGEWILPLDDAYIYLQYAKNLAAGHPFQFNAGDPPSTGCTSLLYPFLLAPGALLGLRGDGLAVYAFVINAAFLAATLVLLFRILAPEFGAATAFGSSLLVLLTGPIAWGFLTGMEIGFFTAIFLLCASTLAKEAAAGAPPRWGAALLVLLVLARPEGMFFAGLLASIMLVPALRRREEAARRWPLALVFVAAILLLALNHALSGSFSPNSSHPTSPLYLPWPSLQFLMQHATNYWAHVGRTLLMGAPTGHLIRPLNAIDVTGFVFPGALLFSVLGAGPRIAREIRDRRIGIHCILGLWFVFGVFLLGALSGNGQHHFRYLLPFLVVFVAYAVPGIVLVADAIASATARFTRSDVAFGMLGLAFVAQALTFVNFLLLYGQEAHVFSSFRDVARWTRDNTPPGTRIAALDVGIVAWESERPIYDLYGLTTNEMTRSTFYFADVMGSKFEVLEKLPPERRPQYFFGHRVRGEEHGDEGHLAFFRKNPVRFAHPVNESFGSIGQDLALWKLDWTGVGTADAPHDEATSAAAGGMTIVDALDVADLDSQDAHDHRIDPLLPLAFPANRIVEAACAGGEIVTDGALGIQGVESFDLRGRSAGPGLLVLRTIGTRGRIGVRVNGAEQPPAEPPPGVPGQWQEMLIPLPAGALRPELNRIELAGQFLNAHVWLFQS